MYNEELPLKIVIVHYIFSKGIKDVDNLLKELEIKVRITEGSDYGEKIYAEGTCKPFHQSQSVVSTIS
jgi:hypothetical protein